MSGPGEVTIYVGGVFASREAAVVKTLLGSCISACIWDPVSGAGGMNHFMLPNGGGGNGTGSARFGVQAMELLIGELQKLGGERARLQAKAFGGGQVLHMANPSLSVPEQNIRFIRQFMLEEGIPLIAHDFGGRCARQVVFNTQTGKALVKRLPSRVAIPAPEVAPPPAPRAGEITLFD